MHQGVREAGESCPCCCPGLSSVVVNEPLWLAGTPPPCRLLHDMHRGSPNLFSGFKQSLPPSCFRQAALSSSLSNYCLPSTYKVPLLIQLSETRLCSDEARAPVPPYRHSPEQQDYILAPTLKKASAKKKH